MRWFARCVGMCALLAVMALACASPSPRGAAPRASSPIVGAARHTQVTIASPSVIGFLPNDAQPGAVDLRHLVNPGLTVLDDRGNRQPLLVDAVPSLDNGLWSLRPDGGMETTWRIRAGAEWHDGEPLTSDDLLFTLQVGRDGTTGIFGGGAFSSVEDATAPDARTITVSWKQPYVDADQLFTQGSGFLLPKHLLQAAYEQDRTTLSELPFWTVDYVGSGPYALRQYDPGSRFVLSAFDRYLPGRPSVDEIDVVYMPDVNAIIAALLAGTVDVTIGTSLPLDATLQMRDRWQDGTVTYEFGDHRWINVDPQFVDASPAIIDDLRFRQALFTAIDRKELADSLTSGLAPVVESFMAPNQPQYTSIVDAVPKYPYDPQRSAQQIEELGYRKGPDGMYVGADGQPLEVELRASANQQRQILAVAQYWKTLGVATTTATVPPQRTTDWPWRASFPGFQLQSGTIDLDGLQAQYGSHAMLASNNYQVTGLPNWPRYQSPDLDRLLDRYYATIPLAPRLSALTDINVFMMQNLVHLGMYYAPIPYAVAARVVNVPVNRASKASVAWNVQQWTVRS